MPKSTESRALIVGINDYPDCPLAYCVHDAQETANILREPEYSFEIDIRLDSEVTRPRLQSDLHNLFSSSADLVLLYFSGHGLVTPYGAYIVTPDSSDIDPGVDLALLSRMIQANARSGRFTTIVLDCCHSGALRLKSGDQHTRSLTPSEMAKSFPSLPEGSVLLAACRPEEKSFETSELGHGVFTYHLLDGLMGEAANHAGEITPGSLYDYVARVMSVRNLRQNVVFRGDISGSIVLGSGFRAKERLEYSTALADEVDNEAKRHVTSFRSSLGDSYSDRELWSQSGYRAACQLLSPVLAWFDKKQEQYPELLVRSNFQSFRNDVVAWQARLSDLDGVAETPWGSVKELLGYGTFGTVWKTEFYGATTAIRAWKLYHGQDIRIKDKVHRFRRGYEAMRMLDHPHIIKVGEFTDCPFGFLMDFIDGPNFRNFTGAIEVADQLHVLLTVAETLAHAHSRGVVHRDVKPENILMKYADSSWHPYLTDFDLAWFSTASSLTRDALGSTFYSAPEQIYKPTSVNARDPKVDVYAFGQLCFFGITGSDPLPNPPDNYQVLKRAMAKWPAGDAANSILHLYQSTTLSEPSKRTDNFRTICDRLHRIILLLNNDPDDVIETSRFIREVAFGLSDAPLDDYVATSTFKTLSRQTEVATQVTAESLSNLSLVFDLEKLEQLALEGVDHEAARRRLNARVDESIRQYPWATRRSGRSGTYRVAIIVDNLPLTMDGVAKARELLSRVIETIERV